MRTTVDLPDALFREAKVTAARQGIPLRVLIENAVSRELTRGATKGARIEGPLVRTRRGHVIRLTNAKIEELLA
jgi:hypothetical protein